MRRAEQATTGERERDRRKHRSRELSQRVWEGGAGDASIYSQGRGLRRHRRPGHRARGEGPAAAGDCGRGGRGRLAGRSLWDRRAGIVGAWQVLARRSLPALARPADPPPPSGLGDAWAGPRTSSPPDGRARPRPGGACAPRERGERASGRACDPLCEPRG